MVPFADDLNVEKIHVQAPTEVIFLCGGPYTDIGVSGTTSMRDAFRKVINFPAIGSRDIVLAEDITKLSVFSACYEDILEFETDLAQITELILLFCESEGSFTELGSFVSISEIASRLLVVVRDFHWKEDSFIKLGPLRFLRRKYENSVFIIEDAFVGIEGRNVSAIKLDQFRSALDEPLIARFSMKKEPSTFDPTRAGHVIKLVVGLTQEYGALEEAEIIFLLAAFGVEVDALRLKAFILCAQTVDWVEKYDRGFREFIVPKVGESAFNYSYTGTVLPKNRARRKLIIREYWETHDQTRFRVISDALGNSK